MVQRTLRTFVLALVAGGMLTATAQAGPYPREQIIKMLFAAKMQLVAVEDRLAEVKIEMDALDDKLWGENAIEPELAEKYGYYDLWTELKHELEKLQTTAKALLERIAWLLEQLRVSTDDQEPPTTGTKPVNKQLTAVK